ncbi:MAG TPA: DNA mismatch repair protein MutT [Lachnospiraceae bacterium]|nr:DNA mismatch repair protein MutT [Lachnospiraceae bacterium]
MTLTTLCYIENEDSYLMMHRIKKEKDINKDKWIGIGGHFESGESPEECLMREAWEETGLTLTSYRLRGIITFLCDDITDYYMFLYTADGFTGTLTDCREGTLEWVSKDRLTELNLWEGDLIFFRLLKENAPFFSLKLCYADNVLTHAVLNGNPMELLDIADEQGNPTGKVRERSLVHLYGNRHRTSHIWIIRPSKTKKNSFDVLLQKRAEDKDSFPGCYDISSAGHIPAGCGYLPSALRELKEELGITAKENELVFIGFQETSIQTEFYGKPFRNHEYSAVYLLNRDISISSIRFQKDEIESVIWMDYEDCLQKIKNGTLKHCIFQDEFELLKKSACVF